VTNAEELNNQQLSPIHSVIPSYDIVLPEVTDTIGSQRSASTISTGKEIFLVRPSTVTQLSGEQIGYSIFSSFQEMISFSYSEKFSSWNHPLETNLMNSLFCHLVGISSL